MDRIGESNIKNFLLTALIVPMSEDWGHLLSLRALGSGVMRLRTEGAG